MPSDTGGDGTNSRTTKNVIRENFDVGPSLTVTDKKKLSILYDKFIRRNII